MIFAVFDPWLLIRGINCSFYDLLQLRGWLGRASRSSPVVSTLEWCRPSSIWTHHQL